MHHREVGAASSYPESPEKVPQKTAPLEPIRDSTNQDDQEPQPARDSSM